jgi:hypothetical protein
MMASQLYMGWILLIHDWEHAQSIHIALDRLSAVCWKAMSLTIDVWYIDG